jgi:hypothetical protein
MDPKHAYKNARAPTHHASHPRPHADAIDKPHLTANAFILLISQWQPSRHYDGSTPLGLDPTVTTTAIIIITVNLFIAPTALSMDALTVSSCRTHSHAWLVIPYQCF